MIVDDHKSSSLSISTECSPSSLWSFAEHLSSTNSAKPRIMTTIPNRWRLMFDIDSNFFQLKVSNEDRSVNFWWCTHRSCCALVKSTLENELVRYSGPSPLPSHLPNLSASKARNLPRKDAKESWEWADILTKTAEQEVRQALLIAEALVGNPSLDRSNMALLFLCMSINAYICCSCLFQATIWCVIDVKQLLQYHDHRPFPYRNIPHAGGYCKKNRLLL